MSETTTCTAFAGTRRIASGDRASVSEQVKRLLEEGLVARILIFDDASSEQVEVDMRDPAPEPPAAEPERRPGRPKLGVVGREVTLLPRHWEWLNGQPGGASVALRKLVEEARRANAGRDRVRRAQEAAYRFMSAMAGNEAGFEEATRALFAGQRRRFDDLVEGWPPDVRDHLKGVAAPAFQG